MKSIRELFSDTLVYGISSVAARFINYLLVPFYTKYFAPAEYGIISLIFGAMVFLNVVFTFGMESAYLRYATDRKRAGSVYKTLQLVLLGTGTVLALILWLFKPMLSPLLGLNAVHGHLYLMMIGILWFDALSAVPFAELRLIRKSWTFALIRLTNVLINVGLNLYLVIGLHWGIAAVLLANLIASAFALVMSWIVTSGMWKGVFEKSLLNKALAFGLPYVPAGIGYAINETLDRFFLKQMPHHTIISLYGSGFNADAVIGIYSACYKLAVFMLLFIQMFRMAWQPFFMRYSADDNAPHMFRDVFRYFNLVAGVVFISVCLFTHQIVRIHIPLLNATLINDRFWPGLFVVPWLMMSYWFQGWYVNFTAGIFIREHTRSLPVIMLTGAGVTVVCNLLLIPAYGMLGAAWATLASYLVMAVMIYFYSQRVYKISYQMTRAVIMILISVLVVILGNEYSSYFVNQIPVKILLWLAGISVVLVLGLVKRLPFPGRGKLSQ